MTLHRIPTGELTLSVDVGEAATGAADAETVLLLHGFPDSHKLWRYQIPVLREAGYRTVAPDLRGFGESDWPSDVRDYRLTASVKDMVALLDHLGIERAHVVCHDFGAVVGWLLAALQPDRVDRLAALSVGHPMSSRVPTIEQRQKQWYMLLFQFEGVAEELLSRNDWALFRQWTAGSVDQQLWIDDLSRPGALPAALNWYRANQHPSRELQERQAVPSVAAPTLGLWSDGDLALTEEQMQRSATFVTGRWTYERVEHASHWMQVDQPERVNRLLLQHFSG